MATVSRGQYAVACLASLGNILPTKRTEQFLVNWTTLESRPPGARYNLLNCTQKMPGSTFYNVLRRNSDGSPAFGVQNYSTLGLGVAAFVITLRNGRYPHLLHALMTSDENSLGMHTGRPSVNVEADLAVWTGGHAYNPASVQGNPNQLFTWGGSGIMPTSPPTTQQPAPAPAPAPAPYNPPQSNTGIGPVDAAINSIASIFKPLLVVADAVKGIANWTNNPVRILKLLLGILLLIISLLLFLTDAFEAFSKSGVGQAALKTAGKVAA